MSSKKAVLSDIHGNVEALEAVLAQIFALLGQEAEIICLGDIVGYGPNPIECTELVRKHCRHIIAGNHEPALFNCPPRFNPIAVRSLSWTRKLFDKSNRAGELWQFFSGLTTSSFRDGDIAYVHGSPRKRNDEFARNEYVFPDSVRNPRFMESVFDGIDWLCLYGHTHQAGVITETTESISGYKFTFSEDVTGGSFTVSEGTKAMANVGSVGQPRDFDRRACFVTLEINDGPPRSATIEWHRVEYPVNKTVAKILDIDELDNLLADRLSRGT